MDPHDLVISKRLAGDVSGQLVMVESMLIHPHADMMIGVRRIQVEVVQSGVQQIEMDQPPPPFPLVAHCRRLAFRVEIIRLLDAAPPPSVPLFHGSQDVLGGVMRLIGDHPAEITTVPGLMLQIV